MTKRFKKQIQHIQFLFLILLFGFALLACGKSNENSDMHTNALPANAFINSAELVSQGGCLDVSLYSQRVKSLDPNIPVLHVTTNFSQTSKDSPRHDFGVLNAFSAFMFEWLPMQQAAMEFDGFTQDGCNSMTFHAPDGETEEFKITEHTDNGLKAETKEGKRVEFRWLSPNSVEIKTRHKVLDAPCTNDSAFVEVTKVLDWSGNYPSIIPSESRLSIEKNYLEQVADAVNFNPSQLSDESGGLIFNKLVELAQMHVRAELLSCADAPIDPPEVSDPDDHPAVPPTDTPTEPTEPAEPTPTPEQPTEPSQPTQPAQPAPTQPPADIPTPVLP